MTTKNWLRKAWQKANSRPGNSTIAGLALAGGLAVYGATHALDPGGFVYPPKNKALLALAAAAATGIGALAKRKQLFG